MKVITLNDQNINKKIKEISKESSTFDPKLVKITEKIVEEVRNNGNKSLFKYTKSFDKVSLDKKNIKISENEFKNALKSVSKSLISDLKKAARRIRSYQKVKLPKTGRFKDDLGNELGWLVRPIERVGIYVPGGKAAYPSTVLMTAIPAKVAGVKELVVVTPCPGGKVNAEVLAACSIAGVDSVYKIGGAQAISALAYGCESVPKVDKIVGPGNIYVAIAKKLVYGACDIDMIAGPSEVLVIADGSCPASWIAADLLAQAEHDEMAVSTLVTTSSKFAKEVKNEIKNQLSVLERRNIAYVSLKDYGKIYIVDDLEKAADISNAVAPEHLELCVKSPKSLMKKIHHAGAIFLGSMSTEPFGDYICGPSHVLPTGGAARFSSPLSVYDFIRMPSTIAVSKKGFNKLGDSVVNLAMSEGLEAHALSVKKRKENN